MVWSICMCVAYALGCIVLQTPGLKVQSLVALGLCHPSCVVPHADVAMCTCGCILRMDDYKSLAA